MRVLNQLSAPIADPTNLKPMRKICLVFLALVTLSITSFSQSILKGTVKDTVEHKSLVNTTFSLMRKADSVLVAFSRADKDGNFSMNKLPEGEFILLATHPYLGDYFDNVKVPANGVTDLGTIIMTPKSKLLAEVILKSGSPIRIKGDTTVYTADSFKVRPGANVEELLRRLPGIQVDRNGQITAMGEKVKKVLVDGEEFFGSDPGIATKNLRADVVKEVEVFDKKSDQAEFTGIDDGVKDKTINLKLKDDKKKGYFGKAEAGGGLKDKFNNSVMLNAFKSKRKVAGYGIMSNTGQTNLDWQDAQNYGGGSDNVMTSIDDGGGMTIMVSNDDEGYYGGSNGIPTNWNGGLHFSNKYNKDRNSFNSAYKFSKVNAPGFTEDFSTYYFPDSNWNSHSRSDKFSSTVKQAFNMTVDLFVDSLNSLKWTTKANGKTTDSRGHNTMETMNETKTRFINTSDRTSTNHTENKGITSTLLWKHKFRKPMRTLSVNTDLNWGNTDNKGLLYSLNDYYLGGVLNRRDTTDQENTTNSANKSVSSKIVYTRPVAKDVYLELNTGLSYLNNSSERITRIKDLNDKYTGVVDSLSNNFIFNRLVFSPGVNLKINKKKYNIGFGFSAGLNHFIQKDVTKGTDRSYDFSNFFPIANFLYKFKPSQNLRFNYNGSSQAPSLEQLQPTRVNSDPLNVYVGNPNLKQSFRHSFSIGYNSYNVLKEKNIWSNMSVTLMPNAFSQSNRVDSLGRRIYQTVNVRGNYSMNLYTDFGFKIKGTKMRVNFGPNVDVNRNVDFINGIMNTTTSSGYGLRVQLGEYVPDKMNFNIGPSLTRRISKATVNKASNAEYWQFEAWGNLNFNIKKKWEIGTDVNSEIRQKDPRFTSNNSITKWNASIVRHMMKNALDLKFGVYDILNQNKGYSRNLSSYSFSETYNTTLKRFWMVTLTWNISKNGKPMSNFF